MIYFYSFILHLCVIIMPLYVECLSHSASMKADVMWSVKQQQGSEGELESNQRDKTNACNLKMISLALTKNSLNTDQSSIDRITVQQSLCITIIFSRVERKSLKFFLAHTWSVHVSPARTNAYSLFWEWNIILSWPGNGSFHLLLGIVRPSSTWQLSLDQRFPS